MEICQVVLINFAGVEGECQFDLFSGLNQLPAKSALIPGIRFVLDQTFQYENTSEEAEQSVQVVIRNLESDDRLSIKRTVQNSSVVQIEDSRIPLGVYFQDFGQVIGCIGENYFRMIREATEKELLQILFAPDVQLERDVFLEDVGHSEDTFELEEWQMFLRKRIDRLVDIPERNVLIRRSKTLDKCRKMKIKESLMSSVEVLNQKATETSSACNEIQKEFQAVKMEMVIDQQTARSCDQVRAFDYFSQNTESVLGEFEEILEMMKGDMGTTSSWFEKIHSEQKRHFREIHNLGNVFDSKDFQLEINLKCLELTKLSEFPLDSLQKERIKLSPIYKEYSDEFKMELKNLEKLMTKNEDFERFFRTTTNGLVNQIEQEIEELKGICKDHSELVKVRNVMEIDKIKLRSRIAEIRGVLCDYDKSVLDGLSSVVHLLGSEKYRELKGREFLGVIFQSIEFKENCDVAAENYFRKQLKDLFPTIVVRTSSFAQKLMKDFNDSNLRGTISIMSCDNYRQKPQEVVKEGISLPELLVNGESHPFFDLLNNFVYNEAEDLLKIGGDCEEDPATGGLTMRENICQDLSIIQTEKWLAEFLKAEEKLLECERDSPSLDSLQEMTQKFNGVFEQFDLLTSMNAYVNISINHQKIVQEQLKMLNIRKTTLMKIDWKQMVNKRLMDLADSNGLGSSQFYEEALKRISKLPRDKKNPWRYDESVVDDWIRRFSYLALDDPVINWPNVSELITRRFSYIDIDIPHQETYEELRLELKGVSDQLNSSFKNFMKLKRIKGTQEVFAKSLEEDIQEIPGNPRGHARQSVEEIEREMTKMAREMNVYPTSKLIPVKTVNAAKKVLKTQLEFGGEISKSLTKDLLAFLDKRREVKQQDSIHKLHSFIEHFYEAVKPEPVDRVELLFKAEEKLSMKQLSLKDLAEVEVIFGTEKGNFTAQEMEPSDVDVFAIAVLFAKMLLNETNKVVLIKDCDHLGTETMEVILKLFLAHHFQVILESDSPVLNSLVNIEGEEATMDWSDM